MQGKSSAPASPRFLADAMLGRLAKWLRLLGFDTCYAGHSGDHQIAALARVEGRVVLTRDRELTRRKGIRCLLIDSQVLEEQLAQVIAVYGLASPGNGSLACSGLLPVVPRCPACNGALIEVPREQARVHVPVYVWETHRRFLRCLGCEKLYWPGSHWERIQSTLARIIGHEGFDK
jgi:uncharacterized protein with PIN domain